MPAKKQITKEMILTTAFEMLRTGGMETVNVKDLAKQLGCSTQPIYLSFDNMDALRRELYNMAVDAFLCRIGEGNLYDMAYIQFAKEEKALFRFLFLRQNAFSELREALAPMMETSISRIMEQYHIDHEEAHRFHDQLWIHAHGIASMIAMDFCDWDIGKAEKMLTECREYLEKKYGGQNVQQ